VTSLVLGAGDRVRIDDDAIYGVICADFDSFPCSLICGILTPAP
jgi:hypothetical protein